MSIEVRNVSKRFGDFVALDDVTVSLPTGQLTALLGPSGGGKSTLLRIIAGLDSADDGTISIEGTEATHLPPQKRNVGFVFQHYAVFKHMTVAKNVAFGLEIRKRPKAEIAQRVDELLRLVHLQQFAHRLPSQLSGGQRQRMALARALAVEPKVLLLDEPFGALDAKVRKELREWLRRLHDEVHVTTVFVTHDQEEALEVADEIVVINDGRVEQVGTPDELYDEPANDFVMGFLGEVTTLNGVLLRPHDVDVSTTPHLAGAAQGTICRILRIGFEVRVTVLTDDGEEVDGRAHRPTPARLRLENGATVLGRARLSPGRCRTCPRRAEDERSAVVGELHREVVVLRLHQGDHCLEVVALLARHAQLIALDLGLDTLRTLVADELLEIFLAFSEEMPSLSAIEILLSRPDWRGSDASRIFRLWFRLTSLPLNTSRTAFARSSAEAEISMACSPCHWIVAPVPLKSKRVAISRAVCPRALSTSWWSILLTMSNDASAMWGSFRARCGRFRLSVAALLFFRPAHGPTNTRSRARQVARAANGSGL